MNSLLNLGSRFVFLSGLALPEALPPNEDYIVLLPAYNKSENVASLVAARFYMTPLCREYCCVGAVSAELEDEIDSILEDSEIFLPTTSFLDAEEACDHFLFAADAGIARNLFAAIADHDGLVEIIYKMVGNKGRRH